MTCQHVCGKRLAMVVHPGYRDQAWKRYLDRCGPDSTVLLWVKTAMQPPQHLERARMRILGLLPMSPEPPLSAVRPPCQIYTDHILPRERSQFPARPLHGTIHQTSMHRTHHLSSSVADHRWTPRGPSGSHSDGAAPRNLLPRVKTTIILEGRRITPLWLVTSQPLPSRRTCLLLLLRKICHPNHSLNQSPPRCKRLPASHLTSRPCILPRHMRSRSGIKAR